MSDVDLKDLLPEPFLTVRPGDQVTVFINGSPSSREAWRLKEMLIELAPEVSWFLVHGAGVTGVVHVARGDKKASGEYVKLGEEDRSTGGSYHRWETANIKLCLIEDRPLDSQVNPQAMTE